MDTKKVAFSLFVFVLSGNSFASILSVGNDEIAYDVFGKTERSQAIYNNDLFVGGPVFIDSISFFATNVYPDHELNATFSITLSTQHGVIEAPSSTFDNNVGSNAALFDSRIFSSATFAQSEAITFSGKYLYDPAQGDLIVDVVRADVTGPNSVSMAASFDFGPFPEGGGGRPLLYNYRTTSSKTSQVTASNVEVIGLKAEFNLTPVPAPATAWLFGTGLISLIGMARK